jgi:hypothetical protein
MSNNDKQNVLTKIGTINKVEGFDPTPLAVEYIDLNSGEKRLRLPVMSQIAWFRLKYPEGKFAISVMPSNDYFVATVRVYKNHTDSAECYLSEATASRGYSPEKPTVSPREWAQTAALGIALRNAGFGLQFHAAGESFDEAAVDELGATTDSGQVHNTEMKSLLPSVTSESSEDVATMQDDEAAPEVSDEELFENAKKLPCPISKYMGKTLGDMITIDPGALVWVANKFTGDPALTAAAKLICNQALAAAA